MLPELFSSVWMWMSDASTATARVISAFTCWGHLPVVVLGLGEGLPVGDRVVGRVRVAVLGGRRLDSGAAAARQGHDAGRRRLAGGLAVDDRALDDLLQLLLHQPAQAHDARHREALPVERHRHDAVLLAEPLRQHARGLRGDAHRLHRQEADAHRHQLLDGLLVEQPRGYQRPHGPHPPEPAVVQHGEQVPLDVQAGDVADGFQQVLHPPAGLLLDDLPAGCRFPGSATRVRRRCAVWGLCCVGGGVVR